MVVTSIHWRNAISNQQFFGFLWLEPLQGLIIAFLLLHIFLKAFRHFSLHSDILHILLRAILHQMHSLVIVDHVLVILSLHSELLSLLNFRINFCDLFHENWR